jgi:hypothetical protein
MLLGNLNSIYGGTAHKEGNRASRGPVGTNCWCTICKRELFVYFVEISCFHPYRIDSERGEPEGGGYIGAENCYIQPTEYAACHITRH